MLAHRGSSPFGLTAIADFAGIAAIAGILTLAAALAVPAAATERFSGETTNVVAVEVPVQVILGGEPVRGLTAADFEVSEGRRKLKVVSFEALDLTRPPGDTAAGKLAAAAIPAAARRHFLLLFDLTFSEPKSIVKAREAATDLVARSLHPTDLVAVATYSAAQGPQLVLGFTADRRQIAKAIETLGLPQLLERTQSSDPLRLVYQFASDELGGRVQAHTGGPKEAIKELLVETLKAETEAGADLDRQHQTQRVQDLSRSLADLARMMGNVDGRKTVIYLSEGFDSALLTGTTDSKELDESRENSARTPWSNSGDQIFGDSASVNRMEKMFEAFRRADCVIQAVDIGGVRGQGDLGLSRPSGREALFSMAKETGGELFENYNDLSAAMGQMLKRTSVTYVLTVQPDDLKLDGEYHRLKVELRNGPKGARVVAKPGFYAPRPFAQHNPLERMLNAADAIVAGVESGALEPAVLATPFRVAGAAYAFVPVLVEVDGPGLLANLSALEPATVVPVEIYAYALDASGGIRDFFTQNLRLDLAKVSPQLNAGGLKFYGHLELPVGEYSLRVLVRNGRTGVYGLKVLPVQVPAFDQAGPYLLPPLFPDPAGRWLMTREVARGEARDIAYPFLDKERPYVPASRPTVGSGETPVILLAYGLAPGEVAAAVRILGAGGKELAGGKLAIVDREPGAAGQPERLNARFQPPPLAAGTYELQVTLTPAGGAKATRSIAFVVAPPGKRPASS